MPNYEEIDGVLGAAGLQRPSLMSLRLDLMCENKVEPGELLQVGVGTGFLFDWKGRPYLVTNRHNLTGRRQDTGELMSKSTGAVPDTVLIHHNVLPTVGPNPGQVAFGWQPTPEPLYGPGGARAWFEDPVWGERIDVVILPLTTVAIDSLMMTYTSHDFSQPLGVGPSQELSIVGFPYGESSGGNVAVWVRGAIATEPNLDHGGLPRFLIDARTRQGQSGSPVIIYSASGVVNHARGTTLGVGPYQRLVGVYSGRTSDESDLGFVWKAQAIVDILEGIDVDALPPLDLVDLGGDADARARAGP